MSKMKYRTLPHGGEQISVIGLGMGYIHEGSEAEIQQTVEYAIEKGVNYFDMAGSEAKPYPCYARAFKGRREKVYLQMHFGAIYDGGKYGWTRDLDKIKGTFKQQLELLGTDYADFGFVHCIDEATDFDEVMSGGIWEHMKDLKKAGHIHHLGVSSHDPDIVRKFLDTGLIDMVMFSINPAYDYSTGDYAIGDAGTRGALYRECEQAGVGISVMKPFGGGQLLSRKTSPFKEELTKNQCIQYALDRPGVINVLPGIRNSRDLKDVLRYLDSTEEERDYSVIGNFTPANAEGICVYCNHCQPCPQGIDVGLMNKYYDLALAGDEMAKGHYDKLHVKASACVKCGHCQKRCPFHVKQESRMEEIATFFEE